NDLTKQITQWAMARDLHTADPVKQMLKLAEEFGEVAEGMAKNRKGETLDGIGDMYVVLTILALQLDTNIQDCVSLAYQEIKNRKGKLVNGVYVKEEDL